MFFHFVPKVMDKYVTYNTQLHTLICRQHKFGLGPDWVERHFRNLHKAIPLEMHQEIIKYAKSLDLWEPILINNLSFFVFPIPELSITAGWQCQYDMCQELRRTEGSIEK